MGERDRSSKSRFLKVYHVQSAVYVAVYTAQCQNYLMEFNLNSTELD